MTRLHQEEDPTVKASLLKSLTMQSGSDMSRALLEPPFTEMQVWCAVCLVCLVACVCACVRVSLMRCGVRCGVGKGVEWQGGSCGDGSA